MKISHTCYFNVTHPFPFTVTNTRLASISDSYRFWNTVRKTLISSVYYAYCVYMHAACQATLKHFWIGFRKTARYTFFHIGRCNHLLVPDTTHRSTQPNA